MISCTQYMISWAYDIIYNDMISCNTSRYSSLYDIMQYIMSYITSYCTMISYHSVLWYHIQHYDIIEPWYHSVLYDIIVHYDIILQYIIAWYHIWLRDYELYLEVSYDIMGYQGSRWTALEDHHHHQVIQSYEVQVGNRPVTISIESIAFKEKAKF